MRNGGQMRRFIIGIFILVVISLGVYYLVIVRKKTADDFVYNRLRAHFHEVSDYVETNGQIEPLNRVEILPPSGGRIEKIFVEEGNEVKAGDILCLLSSSDRVAILDAARAISEDEYRRWEDSYKPIKVLAPISGRVILRNIVEGQTVGAQTVLFAISDRLIAVASVDESEIGKVSIGQKAFITLDAYPDKTMTGRVFQILDEGKNVSNVIIYKVKINIDEVPRFLKSHMTASIRILISRRKVLSLPAKAIEYSKDGKVYVITGFNSKKEPIKREIKTGKDYGDIVEIKEGLKEGDEVFMKVVRYSKQQLNNATNPFMPQRKRGQKGIMKRI